MQMYDLPLPILLHPHGGVAHISASTQASNYRNIPVVGNLLFSIGCGNACRSPALNLGDLLLFCLLLATRNHSEVISLEASQCLPITFVVRLNPLLFSALQI